MHRVSYVGEWINPCKTAILTSTCGRDVGVVGGGS